MGGLFSASANVQSITQKSLNDITQKSSAACSANCSQIQTGNTIFLNGATTGNITFNQQCTVNAKCQITNSIEAAASAVQKAIASGSAKPGWFLGIAQINVSEQSTDQEVINKISQAMDSTCNNGASQVQANNLIFVQNSTTGDIGFNQSSDVNSQCVLSNLAKGTATTTQQADLVSQAGGVGGAIIAAIVLIIVIAVVIIVVAGAAAARKKQEQQAGAGGGGGSAGAGRPSQGGIDIAGAIKAANTCKIGGPEASAACAVVEGSGEAPPQVSALLTGGGLRR